MNLSKEAREAQVVILGELRRLAAGEENEPSWRDIIHFMSDNVEEQTRAILTATGCDDVDTPIDRLVYRMRTRIQLELIDMVDEYHRGRVHVQVNIEDSGGGDIEDAS